MRKIWNLTKNDIFSLWKSSRFLFVLVLLYQALYCVVGSDLSFLSMITVIVGGMFSYNSIAYDEKNGWNRFVLTTAYSRKDYVLGKYLLAFTGTLAGALVALLSDSLAMTFGRVEAEATLSPILPAVIAATFLMVSFSLPLSFLFGMEKARIVSLLTVAMICGTAGGASVLVDGRSWNGSLLLPSLIILTASLAILCLSALLSVNIYSRRQL